ncbi:MAG: PEP-CTERM sorting domain-containing protein [Candidatus Acidiferrales bacterium]
MRKLLVVVAVFFAMATVSQASPSDCVTGTLGSFVSLGTAGCSINGNVVADVTTDLSSTLQGDITLTPITSGSGAGGFTASLDLAALAGTSSTLNFTLAAPVGFNLTDLSVGITGGAGASLNLTAANGLNVTAISGGSVLNPTFSGVGSLNLSGTLDVSADSTGTATLTITPSLTSVSSTSPTPEPPALSLFAIGLLGLGLVYRRKMVAKCG